MALSCRFVYLGIICCFMDLKSTTAIYRKYLRGHSRWIFDDYLFTYDYYFIVLTTIRIIKFYSVKQLAQHLLNQYESSKKTELKEEYFQAISDIFILSIKQDRPSITKLISNFLYNEYKKVREVSEEFVEYPQSYTNLILRATEILTKNKSSTFQFVNYRGIGGIWLLGESGDYKISSNTYWTLWRALKIAIEYGRDDMVLFYWQNAHQYYAYNLSINHHYPTTEEQKTEYREKNNRGYA